MENGGIDRWRLGGWPAMLRAAIAAAIASLAASASAQNTSLMLACVRIDNDLDRLACYDRHSGRTPVVEADSFAGLGTAWAVQTEKSAMTDDTNVFLTVESEEDATCRFMSRGKATLFVRCRENTTSVIIHTGCHMTSSRYNDYGDVDVRLDDLPAKTVAMTESTNSESLGLWSGGQSIPLIKEMFGKRQMLTRVRPYGDNALTFTFNIRGLEDAIKPLRDACRW